MANYDITYSCGHPGIVNLTGKHSDRERGYHWGPEDAGVMGLLSMREARRVWTTVLPYTEDEDEMARNIKSATAGIADTLTERINPIDIAMAREVTRQQAQNDADRAVRQITAGPKPERPECHPRAQHPEGRWNGKYYGPTGRRNYYVENINYTLTDAEYDDCMDFRSTWKKWNEATK